MKVDEPPAAGSPSSVDGEESAADAGSWDAFISYTHSDLPTAMRIQAFIEDYPLPGRRRKLRIFRDKTDLAGGDLNRNLPSAIRSARVLLVCCSEAAARSAWVAREIAEFDAFHGDERTIVPLLLAGDSIDVTPSALAGRETLVLDLRDGWRFGRPRSSTRVELLRAVATVAGVPLRDLIPWDALRRRRRRMALGGAAMAAALAVGIAGADVWLTKREATAAALRRDAETATLKLDAGDIPAGVAALGQALARDSRGLLTSSADVLRHWLAVLPSVRDTGNAAAELVRVNRQTYLHAAHDAFVPLDVKDPYVAVADRRSNIVAAGPREIALFAAGTAAPLARVGLPAGSRVESIRVSRDRAAVAVLTTMTRVTNDEDDPQIVVPCTALFIDGKDAGVGARQAVAVQLNTTQSAPRVIAMQPVGPHVLLWHDCTEAKIDQTFNSPKSGQADSEAALADASASEVSTPDLRLSLDVPRLPSDVDIAGLASNGWDEAMTAGWPSAPELTVTKLPVVTPEHTLWHDAGDERTPAIPQRFGLVGGMDDAAFDALGIQDVQDNGDIAQESYELGGFAYRDGRVFWGTYISGNSYMSVARCVAAAAGKVTACHSSFEFIVLRVLRDASADGRRLAVGSQHAAAPPIVVYDAATDAQREPDKEPLAPVERIAFTADSSRLVVLTSSGEVSSYRLADDGAPRYERSIGTHYSEAADACLGQYALRPTKASLVVALTPDCSLQLIDLTTGTLLWRTVLETATRDRVSDGAARWRKASGAAVSLAASEAARSQPAASASQPDAPDAALALSTDGERLLVYADGLAALFQTSTGARLSASFDPLALGTHANAEAAAEARVSLIQDGTLDINMNGRSYRRAPAPSREAALGLLPVLDRRTLLSTQDGHTPLDRLP